MIIVCSLCRCWILSWISTWLGFVALVISWGCCFWGIWSSLRSWRCWFEGSSGKSSEIMIRINSICTRLALKVLGFRAEPRLISTLPSIITNLLHFLRSWLQVIGYRFIFYCAAAVSSLSLLECESHLQFWTLVQHSWQCSLRVYAPLFSSFGLLVSLPFSLVSLLSWQSWSSLTLTSTSTS